MNRPSLSRRRFLARSTLAAASVTVVPRHVLGQGARAPSDRLQLAFIGVGGRGRANRGALKGEQCVALADVSRIQLEKAAKEYRGAERFQDYRRMLDAVGKRLDGVVVSTPDHFHAVAIMAAIQLGKAVYSEKPMAHSIGEVRALMKAAREKRVPTQLGNQGHSSGSIRSFCEWIWDGAIGPVHTVHAGCKSVYSAINSLKQVHAKHAVPPHLDWDLWIGPAKMRPYNPMYEPGRWRSWTPFGTGVIGDWVCHVVDPAFWALDLGAPLSVKAEAANYDPAKHADTYPRGSAVTFRFAAKGRRKALTLVWHDGEVPIPRPPALKDDRKFPGIGAVVLGEKGGIVHGSHGAGGLRLFPQALDREYTRPPAKLPRARGHQADWVQGIKNRRHTPGSNYDYGGPLTELALLGNIAYRFLGRELKWDGRAATFTNCAEANRYINPPYRSGWKL
jgi:predicted dehydrogenase